MRVQRLVVARISCQACRGRDCLTLSTARVCWSCSASHASCGVNAGTPGDCRFELGVDDLAVVPAPAVERNGLATREDELLMALEYLTQRAVARGGEPLNLRMAAPGEGGSLADYWEWYVRFPDKADRREQGLAKRAPGQSTTPAGRPKSTPRKAAAAAPSHEVSVEITETPPSVGSGRRVAETGTRTGTRDQGARAGDDEGPVWEGSPLRSGDRRPPLHLATGAMMPGRSGSSSLGQMGSQMRDPVSATGMSREWSGSSSSGGSLMPNTPVDDLNRAVEARMREMSPTLESELPPEERAARQQVMQAGFHLQQLRRERVAADIMGTWCLCVAFPGC